MPADPLFDHLPPRWRGLRRAAIGYAGLLLVLLAFRVYTAHVATGRLSKAEAAARAAGDPWTAADLMQPTTAPADNAADLYRQAFRLITAGAGGPTEANIVPNPSPRLDPQWQQAAAKASAAYATVFAIVQQATLRPGCDWQTPWTTTPGSLINVPLNYLNQTRRLATELGDHAVGLHLRGNDAGSLAAVGDILAIARAVDGDHTLVSRLTSIDIDALVCSCTGTVSLDLNPATPAAVAATRRLLSDLAAEEDRQPDANARPTGVEAVIGRSMFDTFSADTWLLRPVFDLAASDSCDFWASAAGPLRAMKIPATALQPTSGTPEYLTLPYTGIPVTPLLWPRQAGESMLLPKISFYGVAGQRIVMELRLARARLAVRLFKAEHGRWPASVDELVPAYLPAVPRCVQRPEAARVEFVILRKARRDGGDRPMVYVDQDNDHNTPPADAEAVDWTREQSDGTRADPDGRQWRDIDAWPRAAFPSTQPTP